MFIRRSEYAAMRDALLFYACRDSYRRRGRHPKGSPKRFDKAPIVRDHGDRASHALRQVDDAPRPLIGRLFMRRRTVSE